MGSVCQYLARGIALIYTLKMVFRFVSYNHEFTEQLPRHQIGEGGDWGYATLLDLQYLSYRHHLH